MAKKSAGASPAKSGDDDQQKKLDEEIRVWLAEIDAARKREKDYRDDGKRVIEIYDGTRSKDTPFNILFSNTETIKPVMYSKVPRPVVKPRLPGDNPVSNAAAMAGQRALTFMVDTNMDGQETFNETMNDVTLKACLPGRGVSIVKYEYTEEQESVDDDAPEGTEPTTYKKGEQVCTESAQWNRVLFGYATKWSKMPWVAIEEFIDKTEATRLFGKDVTKKLKFTKGEESPDSDEQENKKTEKDEEHTGEKKTCLIYRIWDKDGGRKVRFLAPCYKDSYCKVVDDPLKLTGFYPMPRPLQMIERVDDLCPVSPYKLYESQAEELNRVTRRANRVTEAIKVRGAYASSLGDAMKSIMDADENALVPVKELLAADNKGFEKAIWMLPLDTLQQVLQTLLQARESIKQTIYEIMGIADIMRGSSKASETLGAQEIKSQWGTLRVKPKQGEVQRYARDMLRIMLEIAAQQFSEETWKQMTGLPYLTAEEHQKATAMMQAFQQSPPQTPEHQQQAQQVQQALAQPTWEQVLGALKNDLQRSYSIDIETNSTIEPDAAEDKQHITELLQALAQSMQGIGPLVEQGVLPFEAAKAIMLMITRRFNYGSEIEEYVRQMQPPQPKPDPAVAAEEKRMQMDQADKQADRQLETARLQQEQQSKVADMQATERQAQREHELRLAEIAANKDAELAKLNAQRATDKYKADLEATTTLAVERIKIDGQLAAERIRAQAAITAAREKPANDKKAAA